jgi:plasmid rolling circle replication initiator protein Rep
MKNGLTIGRWVNYSKWKAIKIPDSFVWPALVADQNHDSDVGFESHAHCFFPSESVQFESQQESLSEFSDNAWQFKLLLPFNQVVSTPSL